MPLIHDEDFAPQSLQEPMKDLGLEFYFASMINIETGHRYSQRVDFFNRSTVDISRRQNHYKSYGDSRKIYLSRNMVDLSKVNIADLFLSRTAVRSFEKKEISLDEFSTLLRYANGLRASLPPKGQTYENKDMMQRTSPSGGARFPLELYVVINQVQGIPPGLYHYNIREFCLEELATQFTVKNLENLYGDPIDFANCVCHFFITGVFYRNIEKYGLRGWRVLFLEAGHLAQNIWTMTRALGLEGTSLAGGLDKDIAREIGYNSHQEGLLQSFVLGYR